MHRPYSARNLLRRLSIPSTIAASALLLALVPSARSQTATDWQGTTGTWDTTTTGNWSNGVPISGASGKEATFTSTTGLATTIAIASGGVSSEGIDFNSLATPAYTFTGGTLTLDTDSTSLLTYVTDDSNNAETFNQDVVFNDSALTALTSMSILFGASGTGTPSGQTGSVVFAGGLTLGKDTQISVGGLGGYTSSLTIGGTFVNTTASAAINLTTGGTLNWDAAYVASTATFNIKNTYDGGAVSGVSTSAAVTNFYTDAGAYATLGGGSGVGGSDYLVTNGLILTSDLDGGTAGSQTQLLGSNVTVTGSNTAVTTMAGTFTLPTGASDIFQFYAASNNTLLVSSGIGSGISTLQVQKTGSGTVVLGGSNSFTTGSTAVTAGTLIVEGSSSANNAALGTTTGGTNVTVASGAGLDYAAAGNYQLTIGGTLGVTGGTGTVLGGSIGSTGTSDEINVAGIASISDAPVTIDVYGVSGVTATTGTYTLISGATGSTLNGASSYTLGNGYNAYDFTVGALSESATAIQVAITSATANSVEYWNGGFSGGSQWAVSNGSTSSNWGTSSSAGSLTSLTPGSGTLVYFTGIGSATSTTLGANMSIKGLVVSDSNGVGLNGDGFTLTVEGSGITIDSGAGATTLGSVVSVGAAQTWTNNSANALTFSGQVQTHGNALSLTGTGAIDLTELSDSGGTITDTDSGGVTFSGPVTTNNGAPTFTNNSGTTMTFNGETSLGTGSMMFSGTGNTTVNGVITGTSTGTALTQSGTGTLTLSGTNAYAGTTSVTHGTLLATNTSGSATGTGSVTIASGATLGGSGFLAPTGSNVITIQSGGILAPGISGATSTLTVSAAGNTTAGLLALSGAQLDFNLGAGNTSSELSLTSSFAGEVTGLSGNTFNFTNVSGGTLSTGEYTLILTDDSTSNSSPFTGLTLDQDVALAGFSLTGLTGDTMQLELNSVNGDYALQLDILSVAAVPEPKTWALLGAGLLLLLLPAIRRRLFSTLASA